MALLSLKQITVSFGGPNLLNNVDFQLDRGERVCLVGRNGAGKSTLMKLIAGEVTADSGEMIGIQDLVISRLEQEVPSGGGWLGSSGAAAGGISRYYSSTTNR